MGFDAEGYFRNKRIQSWTAGNNVRHGWVNIRCIFCDDHSNHLGVNPDGGYACWRCRAHGSILKLIVNIERCSYEEARNIAKEYGRDFSAGVVVAPTSPSDNVCLTRKGEVLPSNFTYKLPKPHLRYLRDRGYNPKNIIRKYRVGFIPGKWRNRLIIPMYMNSQIVAFSGRDITGVNEPKYKLGNYRIDRNSIVYNIDSIPNRKAAIVEGYTDVWRIGDGAIATMGTNFSDQQLLLISQRVDEAFVLFDQQAEEVAAEMADQLSAVLRRVHQITIERTDDDSDEEVDPDTLPPELIEEIRDKIWT